MKPFERTWKNRITSYQSGAPIEKAKIGALCRLMTVPENWTKTDPQALDAIRKTVRDLDIAWAITPEQTEQGLQWLNRREIQKQLTPGQQAILDGFSHFRFIGVDEVRVGNGWRICGYPIYRVCGPRGSYFDYRPMPRQSGGPSLEILRTVTPNP